MKYSVEIKAVLKESDPAHATINKIGIERAIEKFKKDLDSGTADFVEITIKEVESGKDQNIA
jgi:hypothetical protein